MRWPWALMVLAVSSTAFAQDDLRPDAGKPKPKPVPGQPAKPSEPAKPPEPAPDSQSRCEASGGQWRDGSCDMQRKWCLDANNRWDEELRRCFGKVQCADGSHEDNGVCVKDAVEPVARVQPQDQPPPVTPVGRTDIPPKESTSSSIWGPVALWTGVGLTALGAGTGFGYYPRKSNLSSDCEGKRCLSSSKEEWDTAKTIGHLSTGSFVAGGALVGLGIVLLTTGGDAQDGLEVGVSESGVQVSRRWVF